MILKNKMFKRKINYMDPLLVEKNERIFYIQNIQRGDIIFDVGANIGELTLLFSRFTGPKGQVHSFEPTPKTFEKLLNLIKFANKKNVIVNNIAVSRSQGNATLNVYDDEFASWNTFVDRPLKDYGIHINAPSLVEVKTINIDQYCLQNSIERIDLLKIDVEGAELSVLQGAERMFREKKVKCCVFEFGQTIFEMGITISDLKLFFNKNNYSVSNVSRIQNIYPVDPKSKMACFSVLKAKPQ